MDEERGENREIQQKSKGLSSGLSVIVQSIVAIVLALLHAASWIWLLAIAAIIGFIEYLTGIPASSSPNGYTWIAGLIYSAVLVIPCIFLYKKGYKIFSILFLIISLPVVLFCVQMFWGMMGV